MKKYLLCYAQLIVFLSLTSFDAYALLNHSWCPYLEPEFVARINRKEIKKIVELGSQDGLNAIRLHNHFKCPVFIFEANNAELIKKNIAEYPEITLINFNKCVSSEHLESIDLLCISDQNGLDFLENLDFNLETIPYIIFKKNELTHQLKNYLKNRNFEPFFDGISLFGSVLLINQSIKNFCYGEFFTSQFIKDTINYNSPIFDHQTVSKNTTPLIRAAWEDNHSLFHNIAAGGWDINYKDQNGNTALIMAAARGNTYPLKKLMQQESLDFNIQNKNGCTALMVAAALAQSMCVALILEDPRGIKSLNIVNNMGMDAEEIAKTLGYSYIAEFIQSKKNGFSIESLEPEYPQNVIHEKVILCGTCRNVAPFLADTIKIMEKIGNLFDDYRVVIYENNSTDETKKILSQWQEINSKVSVTMENLASDDFKKIVINTHDNGDFFKVDLIAHGRNNVLDKIMTPEYNEFNYMIMMDMDFSQPPPSEAIIEVFQTDREWDAVFAYGIGKTGEYWDWYALRDFNQPLGPELIGHDWFCPKHWSLNKTDQWCRVYSAFGGLGIYKKSSIVGCRYSSIVTPDVEQLFKKVIEELKPYEHPVILKYFNDIQKLNKVQISEPRPNMPRYEDSNCGILLRDGSDALVWRMNSFVWQYPGVVDHLPFHASMIVLGHDKLFINPRLILEYTR